MPVVELSYSRLRRLVDGPTTTTTTTTTKQISEILPFLGLDIESEHGDAVRVEYSPNRPDYSTDFGIALGLQGLLGVKTGAVKLGIKKSDRYQISASPGISKIRPFVTGIAALGGRINDQSIKQLMAMQEDLHMGLGRRRKKSSIGIHDLDGIKFPLQYDAMPRTHRFVPLNSKDELSISEIITSTDVGRHYGGILAGHDSVPIILDACQNTISFPPIINSALTTVTANTRNLLVEITGTSKTDAEDMLAMVATVLQSAGFSLETLGVHGPSNSTPELKPRHMTLDPALANKILGINLSLPDMTSALKRSRLDASAKKSMIECTVPAYRFDILGPMDLVEEVALGYGIQNLDPVLSPSQTLGQASRVSSALGMIDATMTGLGFLEALNSSLTSMDTLYTMANRKPQNTFSVIDSKSREHTILRDSILPELLENLSRNIHEAYPQKIFETGTVFLPGSPVNETLNLAAVNAANDASFTGIKSVLQSCLGVGFGIKVKTPPASHPTFHHGRCADILVDGQKTVGIVGEVNPEVIRNHRLRTPVAGFELSLEETILKSLGP